MIDGLTFETDIINNKQVIEIPSILAPDVNSSIHLVSILQSHDFDNLLSSTPYIEGKKYHSIANWFTHLLLY